MPVLVRLARVAGVALGLAWASPMTAAGLLAGLAGMPFGARARFSDAALVFHRYPWGPGGALTLGNVILHTGASLDEPAVTYACRARGGRDQQVRLGDHERAHVLQYLALGPLFLPLYFACGGISHRNRFEQAAELVIETLDLFSLKLGQHKIEVRKNYSVKSPHIKAAHHLALKPGTNVAVLTAIEALGLDAAMPETAA